jgi:hypothetical protein
VRRATIAGTSVTTRAAAVTGQVGAGGVPAGPVEGDFEPVAGGGDGTLPQTDLPGVHLGIAVHGEDLPDTLQHPALDDVGGTSGKDLLGGLEEQPDGPGQLPAPVELGQHEPGAEHDGRVHVVSAGVRPVGHLGPIRALTLRVRDGQAVDVGAQGEHGALAVPLPDVADEPGSDGEHARREAGLLQPGLDRGGRTELLIAELRVHVQVAPELDEFGTERLRQGAGKNRFPGLIGFGLSGHQLVHPLKGRTPGRSTDPRSTKVQPVWGRKSGRPAHRYRFGWVNSRRFPPSRS